MSQSTALEVVSRQPFIPSPDARKESKRSRAQDQSIPINAAERRNYGAKRPMSRLEKQRKPFNSTKQLRQPQ